MFQYGETKKRQIRDTPIIPEIFSHHSDSETQKGSPTNIFGTASHKTFNKKLWWTHPMFKSFRYPKLMKHKRAPPRNVSVPWDKKKIR